MLNVDFLVILVTMTKGQSRCADKVVCQSCHCYQLSTLLKQVLKKSNCNHNDVAPWQFPLSALGKRIGVSSIKSFLK